MLDVRIHLILFVIFVELVLGTVFGIFYEDDISPFLLDLFIVCARRVALPNQTKGGDLAPQNKWSQKEIGDYDDGKCYLVCSVNFHGLSGNASVCV
jgi:hypothetical protein